MGFMEPADRWCGLKPRGCCAHGDAGVVYKAGTHRGLAPLQVTVAGDRERAVGPECSRLQGSPPAALPLLLALGPGRRPLQKDVICQPASGRWGWGLKLGRFVWSHDGDPHHVTTPVMLEAACDSGLRVLQNSCNTQTQQAPLRAPASPGPSLPLVGADPMGSRRPAATAP